MRFDWSTLILQTINFAILVWLLHRFLYKPVLAVIDARQAGIARQYEQAGAAREAANSRLEALERERAAIAGERAATLVAANVEIERIESARRRRAESEAQALLDAARRDLSSEREQAFAEARLIAVDLGLEVARKLLAQVPADACGDCWIARVEKYLDGLSVGEREMLAGQAGGHLTVITANALPPPTAQEWRARLQSRWSAPVDVDFDIDPALIAGVELHLATAVLRFSWQSALAAAREEIVDHPDHR
jgi:F-type H+-transporting ATPase subunit b